MGEFASPAFLTGGIGWQEVLLIMAVLLIFCGRRIPEVMRSLGRGVSQFKKGLSDVENEVRSVTDAATIRPSEDGSAEKPREEAQEGSRRASEEKPRRELPAPRPDVEDVAQDAGEGKAKAEAESEKDPGGLAG
jgi:TatA/E family protein of Tat protein translocase